MMKKPLIHGVLAVLTSLFLISGAAGQQKVELSELSTKVKGPFTRLYVGALSGKMDFEDLFTISGTMISLGLEAGQQVSPSLALYFDLSFMVMPNPTYSNVTLSSESAGITMLGGGFALFTGKGKSYFFADANYAVSSINTGGSTGTSQGGVGINAGFGYDFNLFGKVDLGSAVYYHYSTMKDKPSGFGEPQITNNFFGVRLNVRFGRR